MLDHHAAACHAQNVEPPRAQLVNGVLPAGNRSTTACAETPTAALEVDSLLVRYPLPVPLSGRIRHRRDKGIVAVDGISMTVSEGETVALVGESGSGKTTIAHAILRIAPITAGTIRIRGIDITGASDRKLRPIRRRVQMLYQDPFDALNPRWRVRQLVEETVVIHGTTQSTTERHTLVERVLERVGLKPANAFATRFPHELSGGQLQRVAVGAALIVEPDLLVADEPVSMLDVSTRGGILSLLDELKREHGLALLMITHDLSTAAHFADRVAVLYQGRIVEEGTAADVILTPRHPYTQALVAAVPRIGHRGARLENPACEKADTRRLAGGCRFASRCPLVEPRCRIIDPELRAISTAGGDIHRVACLRVPEPNTSREQ